MSQGKPKECQENTIFLQEKLKVSLTNTEAEEEALEEEVVDEAEAEAGWMGIDQETNSKTPEKQTCADDNAAALRATTSESVRI